MFSARDLWVRPDVDLLYASRPQVVFRERVWRRLGPRWPSGEDAVPVDAELVVETSEHGLQELDVPSVRVRPPGHAIVDET